jgi:hypothetical protein
MYGLIVDIFSPIQKTAANSPANNEYIEYVFLPINKTVIEAIPAAEKTIAAGINAGVGSVIRSYLSIMIRQGSIKAKSRDGMNKASDTSADSFIL